jgi:hypothetical protein
MMTASTTTHSRRAALGRMTLIAAASSDHLQVHLKNFCAPAKLLADNDLPVRIDDVDLEIRSWRYPTRS